MSAVFKQRIEQAAKLIAQADALVVAAGAGMGVDSGLPDFSGSEGFWKAYPTLGLERIDFTQIACPQAFRDSPERAWGFYGHRLALYRQTTPHAGFDFLHRWGKQMQHGCAVFTSNVDGQFQTAGFDPALVQECHGSIHHLQCLLPCCSAVWSAQEFSPKVDAQTCRLLNAPPLCPNCGGLARPNVLMFDDSDWVDERTFRQHGAVNEWLAQARRPLVIELGAGTSIPSVREFSHDIRSNHSGRLIRINPRKASVSSALDISFPMSALAVLSAINAVMI